VSPGPVHSTTQSWWCSLEGAKAAKGKALSTRKAQEKDMGHVPPCLLLTVAVVGAPTCRARRARARAT